MSAARGWLMLALALAAGCGGVMQTVREEQDRHRREDQACAGGDAAACVALGERELASYKRPGPHEGRPLVLASARDRFDRACTLGAAMGCLHLAETWLPARGLVGQSPWRALPPARRACELGLAAGCLTADKAMDAPDPPARRLLLERACDLDPHACPEAASRAATVDAGLMADLAARPCDRGLRDACAQAAEVQFLAEERRDELYARACALDAFMACVCGGLRVERRNPALAQRLFRRACATGDRDACAGLGRLLTAATPD